MIPVPNSLNPVVDPAVSNSEKTFSLAPEEDKMLVQYVRDPRSRDIRGVVVAKRDRHGVARVAWSFANVKAGDRFDKHKALFIAQERINAHDRIPNGTRNKPPFVVRPILEKMKNRARKYFDK